MTATNIPIPPPKTDALVSEALRVFMDPDASIKARRNAAACLSRSGNETHQRIAQDMWDDLDRKTGGRPGLAAAFVFLAFLALAAVGAVTAIKALANLAHMQVWGV